MRDETKCALIKCNKCGVRNCWETRGSEKSSSRVEVVSCSNCHNRFVTLCKGSLEISKVTDVLKNFFMLTLCFVMQEGSEVCAVTEMNTFWWSQVDKLH